MTKTSTTSATNATSTCMSNMTMTVESSPNITIIGDKNIINLPALKLTPANSRCPLTNDIGQLATDQQS